MKKRSLIALLLGGLLSSAAIADCDNTSLSIAGPEHYEYTIKLSKGSINEENSNIKIIERQALTTYARVYQLFTGFYDSQINGIVFFTNLETKESTSVPFYFTPSSMGYNCYITPKSHIAEAGYFQVQSTGSDNIGLSIKIKEFKN